MSSFWGLTLLASAGFSVTVVAGNIVMRRRDARRTAGRHARHGRRDLPTGSRGRRLRTSRPAMPEPADHQTERSDEEAAQA